MFTNKSFFVVLALTTFGSACWQAKTTLANCVASGGSLLFCCSQVENNGLYETKDLAALCGCLKQTNSDMEACCTNNSHEICEEGFTTGDTSQGGDTTLDNPTTSTTTGMTSELPEDPTTTTTSTTTSTSTTGTTTGEEDTGDNSSTGEECQQLGTEGCDCYEGECFAPLSCVEGKCQCVAGTEGCGCFQGNCFEGLSCLSEVCVEAEQSQPPRPQM